MRFISKKMCCYILSSCLLLSILQSPIVAANPGYWRLSEIRVTHLDYANIDISNASYKVKSIGYVTETYADQPLGEVVVLGTLITEKTTDGTERFFQGRFKWFHPPMILTPGIKYPFHQEGRIVKNTLETMRGLNMECYHTLVSPGQIDFNVPGINASETSVMSTKGMEDFFVIDFDFTAKQNYGSAPQECIYRVKLGDSQSYMQYDYVYKWVEGEVPVNEEIRVFINHELLLSDVATLVKSNRTLLPLRAILEALGVDVQWYGPTQTITATKGDKIMKLQIGSYEADLNGVIETLDVSPMIIYNRTMIPVRYLAESFNFDVDWDGIERIVTIIQKQ